jgi:hypothetical protein
MKRTKKLGAVTATMLTLALLGGATNATALTGKGPAATGMVIAVTCHLNDFPTPAGTTTCGTNETGATKLGVAVGAFAGADDKGSPYVGLCATCSVDSKTITYNEGCVLNEPPVTGNAQGSLNVHGTAVTKAGTEAFNAWVPFTWLRVGVIAVVRTGKLNDNGTNSEIVFKTTGNKGHDLLGDVAVGALVPLGAPGTCASTVDTPLDILVPAIDVGA